MTNLNLTLGQVARIVRGVLLGHESMTVDSVCTDSRNTCDGALFVALKGDRFDGHDFATLAVRNGASAVLVQKQIDGLMAPHILVGNTLEALHALARSRRRSFKGKVAAVTGSSGKTTTRRMLHAMLSKRCASHQPERNFNNHIGVPLALLGLDDSHEAAVFEIGCSDFGEIGALTALADPDVGIVTNVGPAHLEKLGSLDGVARAKGEMFLAMREDAAAVVNGDDQRVVAMPTRKGRRVTFGRKDGVDVRLVSRRPLGAEGQLLTMELFGKQVEASIRFVGAYNALNATAAAAAGSVMGLDAVTLAAGLADALPEPGRLAFVPGIRGMTVLDDTYNANPASMRAALDALIENRGAGRALAVIGDMLELGDSSDAAHLELGRLIATLEIDGLVTLGDRSELVGRAASANDRITVISADDHERAARLILDLANPGDTILVKGSRGMKMENVVRVLAPEGK